MKITSENTFHIRHFAELNSTNTYALRHLSDLMDRQIIIADRQTAGYGRFKRSWYSDVPGNITMSIVLKPNIKLSEDCPIANLTQYMSVVLCDLFNVYGVMANIKWPNDVLVKGAKIAGLLSETSITGDRLNGIVLGIGVNLNMNPEQISAIDQPATALNLETGANIEKARFLQRLLSLFFEDYDAFMMKGFSAIRDRYVKRILFHETTITVNMQSHKVTGIAKGFTNTGHLKLLTESQGQMVILAGDVIRSIQ